MNDIDYKTLSLEYNSCHDQIGRLDQQIWQMGSVILPLSLAGLAYFGKSTVHSQDQFYMILVIAIGSITLISTWGILSRTRHIYRHIALYRIREIEKDLDLRYYQYSSFIGQTKEQQDKTLTRLDEKEQKMFKKLSKEINASTKFGFKKLTPIICWVLILGWIILIIREYIMSFV